jgi:hypothetical protein
LKNKNKMNKIKKIFFKNKIYKYNKIMSIKSINNINKFNKYNNIVKSSKLNIIKKRYQNFMKAINIIKKLMQIKIIKI